jgi:site-specific recombinase
MVKFSHHKTLSDLLASVDPQASKTDKILWLEDLISWIRLPISPSGSSHLKSPHHIQGARIKFLLQVLEKNPHWKTKTSQTIESVLSEMNPINLFVQAGLPKQKGFFSELISRIFHKVLPYNQSSQDLTDLVGRLFTNEKDIEWMVSMDQIILNEILKICFTSQDKLTEFSSRFRKAIRSSLIILASQMEAMVFSSELRRLSPLISIERSAFWSYRKQIDHFTETVFDFNADPDQTNILYDQILDTIYSCSEELNYILRALDENGITIDIVFKIELIESYLERSEKLIHILNRNHLEPHSKDWQIFISRLIQDSLQSISVLPFLKSNLHLISRTIVERSSLSGERYITHNRGEYWSMAKAALGGGVLTSLTTLLKFSISRIHAAPFLEGFLCGLNYSVSFIFIQSFHFTLATKQPSMTAPTLASRLKKTQTLSDLSHFLEEVANLTRSQFIAAVGNVGAVIPAAFLIQIFWLLTFKTPILDPLYAHKTLESLDPFTSLTGFYAFQTGMILFLSSILAGYFENWYTYHQLGPRLEQSRTLKMLLKPHHLSVVTSWISRHISALSGSIILGFSLSFTPVLGSFFGLPLDVRHVTLSAGSMTIAASSFTLESLPVLSLVKAILGVLVIGIFNFGVSFILALIVAVTAQNIKKDWFLKVIKLTLRYMKKYPRYFIFPIQNQKSPFKQNPESH